MVNNLKDKLSISILDINPMCLEKDLSELQALGVKNIHIDIVDTSFAENISFGLNTVNSIMKNWNFQFFVHLMINDPILIIKKLKKLKNVKVAVHSNFKELYDLKVCIPVLAINPDTDVSSICEDILSIAENVLIMTVNPGFGGQELIKSSIDNVSLLKSMGKHVTVDGGINEGNIQLFKNADAIVIGSALTTSNNKEEALEAILRVME
ncbi:hypothetical protein GINT2_001038 [Glugoides intestinalis]